MSKILVHDRVNQRHPEISDSDVIAAVRSMIRYRERDDGHFIGVGFDSKGRFIEMVYLYLEEDDTFFVYHAMTPPSLKSLKELEMQK